MTKKIKDILLKLYDLEEQSIARRIPIIGSVKGKWLLEQIQKYKPKKILELGTANGYSGCILGSEGADLITIELNPHIAKEALNNFEKNEIKAQVIIGDGVQIIKELNTSFDLIFIDFHKSGYYQVLEDCLRLLKKNGLMIADNITFEGCQDFKKAILHHPRLQTQIIDIKDGLSFSMKLEV